MNDPLRISRRMAGRNSRTARNDGGVRTIRRELVDGVRWRGWIISFTLALVVAAYAPGLIDAATGADADTWPTPVTELISQQAGQDAEAPNGQTPAQTERDADPGENRATLDQHEPADRVQFFVSVALFYLVITTFLANALLEPGALYLRLRAARAHFRLKTALDEEKQASESAASKGDPNRLSWGEVTAFLDAKRYNTIFSRIQRAQMASYPKLREFESGAISSRQLSWLISLLQTVRGAIELAGPAYDEERSNNTIFTDDRTALQRLIRRLQAKRETFRLLTGFKTAGWFIALTGAFFLATHIFHLQRALFPEGDDQAAGGHLEKAIAAWGFADFAEGVFAVGLLAAATIVFFRLAGWILWQLMNAISTAPSLSTTFDRSAFITLVSAVMTVVAMTVVTSQALDCGEDSLARAYSFNPENICPRPASGDERSETAGGVAAPQMSPVQAQLADGLAALGFILTDNHGSGAIADAASDKDTMLGAAIENKPLMLVVRIAVACLIGAALLVVIHLYARRYEYAVFDRTYDTISVPPELLRLAGGFLVFIVVTALIYMAFVWALTETPVQDPHDAVIKVVGQTTSNFSLQNFIPYSIFLALVGGVLALATQDLLENYFSGISLRVDSPFEEGDRVTIDGGPMLEVNKIGVRTVEFYEVRSNSVLSMPHKALNQITLRNYSKPTLDYRLTVEILAHAREPFQVKPAAALATQLEQLAAGNNDERLAAERTRLAVINEASADEKEHLSKRLPSEYSLNEGPHLTTIPARAEAMLLLAAFVAEGVKRPSTPPATEPTTFGSPEPYSEWLFDTIAGDVTQKALLRRKLFDFYDKDSAARKADGAATFEAKWKELSEGFDDETKNVIASLQRLSVLEVSRAIIQQLDQIIINGRPEDKGFERLNVVTNDLRFRIFELAYMTWLFETISQKHKLTGAFRERRFAVMNREERKQFVVHAAPLVVRISEIYAEIAHLLWEVRELGLKQISKATTRTLDGASLELLDPPRVGSNHELDEEGRAVWRLELSITAKTAEQSDEVLHHINRMIELMWDDFGLGRGKHDAKGPQQSADQDADATKTQD